MWLFHQGICRDVKTQPKKEKRLGGNRAALFVYGNHNVNHNYFLRARACVFFMFRFLNYMWLLVGFFMLWIHAATEGLENMAFVAIAVSLVTYFYGYMNFSLTKSATTLTNFLGTAFMLTLVGGFICDTYLSRFKTCVLFISMELLVRLVFHSSLEFSFLAGDRIIVKL